MKGDWKILMTVMTVGVAMVAASGCFMASTHEKILKDERAVAARKLEFEQARLNKKLAEEAAEKTKCLGNLSASREKAKTTLASLSMQIDKLSGEKGQLSAERADLSGKQEKLLAQVAELERMKAAAERRNADFRKLVEKLKVMMDAGTLEVKPRNGLLVVQMSSDVVFAPGSIRIKRDARDALFQLAATLASFEGRRFQVMGHSDNTPISSARFPSNWELSAARAVEVVKLLIEAGVKPGMINAAGNAEFDPLEENDSPENMSTNRRVEIIFLPKIDELPGFDEVLSGR